MSTVDWGDVFSASDTQTAFTVFYRKLIKIHVHASHWKRYLSGIIQENHGYHLFFVML